MLGHHDKEDDGRCEEIYLLTLVRSPDMDFWCHVVEGSECGREVPISCATLDWTGKAKVSKFQGEVFVKQ